VLLTNHVLSGALIGALARRPLPAFAAGVASHFVLDAMPHWGKWGSRSQFLHVAVPDGLISLAAMGAFAAVSPPDRRLAVLAGMTGRRCPTWTSRPSCGSAGRCGPLKSTGFTPGSSTRRRAGPTSSCWRPAPSAAPR
jgi:hypothetical protein